MSWFWRIAAPIALLLHLSMGAYLIVDDRICTGLGLLALAVPMQWMLTMQAPLPANAPAHDRAIEAPPLSVLAAFGIAGICFVLAVATLR
jgi:hypothetical protein